VPSLHSIGRRSVACFVGVRGPLVSQPQHSPSGARPPEVVLAPPAPDGAVSSAVSLRSVSKVFRVRERSALTSRRVALRAVESVDLELVEGETLALVGESGSGKSTLARLVLGLIPPSEGEVRIDGEDPADARGSVRSRQHVQAVFQDPHGSLNPKLRVAEIVAEPLRSLRLGRRERRERVLSVLDEVRLGRNFADRYPHELSGGQAQRVAIARALGAEPRIVVLDEPTASLDVSIQTHVVALLRDLQERHGLTYLFVSHDLASVRELATRVAVMYLGRLIEIGPADELFERPLHPYTAALLSAVPRADVSAERSRRIVLNGDPPSPLAVPPGCPFHPRCPVAADICVTAPPPLAEHVPGRRAACHFPGALSVDADVRGERTAAVS
jgi:oligopeptide/dipeptide ABC transporter ATP-binding protein